MSERHSIEISGPSHKHLPALDGVRGLAILMVLGYHLINVNTGSGTRLAVLLWSIHSLGWIGVDLFFTLSGFLITGILYDTLHVPHYFRNFYMRRFLRIFPLYYGFIFLLVLLTRVLHLTWDGRQYVLLTYTQNTGIWPVLDFNLSPRVDLVHLWSLAVEEQFYLIWPLIIFMVRDRRRLIAVSLFLSGLALALRIGLPLLGISTITTGVLTPCRVDELLLGGCLALITRGSIEVVSGRWMILTVVAAAGIIVGYTLSCGREEMRGTFFGSTFSYSVIALGSVALLALVLSPKSVLQKVFSCGFLRILGKYSYGIYVLHFFTVSMFGILIKRMFGESLEVALTPLLHSLMLASLAQFVVNTAVVFVAAYASYNLYEVHFLRLKRYFGYGNKPKTASRTLVVQAS